jgi:hypothetical protein
VKVDAQLGFESEHRWQGNKRLVIKEIVKR